MFSELQTLTLPTPIRGKNDDLDSRYDIPEFRVLSTLALGLIYFTVTYCMSMKTEGQPVTGSLRKNELSLSDFQQLHFCSFLLFAQ